MQLGKLERTAARKLVRALLALPDRNNVALAKDLGVTAGMISKWLTRRHLPAAKSQAKIRLYLSSLQKQPPVNNRSYNISPSPTEDKCVATPKPEARPLSERIAALAALLPKSTQQVLLEELYRKVKQHTLIAFAVLADEQHDMKKAAKEAGA